MRKVPSNSMRYSAHFIVKYKTTQIKTLSMSQRYETFHVFSFKTQDSNFYTVGAD